MTSLTTCLDGAVFEFPNHPFNLGGMPYDNTFHFSSSSIQNNVAVQVSSSSAVDLNVTQATTSDARLQVRIEFVAKRLATMPRRFAEQGRTMFIHRMQFQHTCPPTLQDAMSACALYSMKSEANQALVFRNLEHKCQQLIASTNAQLASKTDLLAALQALLLYQMIRLFDGDIRLRVHAEADEPITMLWASQLRAFTRNNAVQQGTAQLAPDTSTRTTIDCYEPDSNWQCWLVDESIRRTVIITFPLQGVYNFLKLGYDGPTDLRLCFTAQTALWSAQSEIGWRWVQEHGERLEIRVTQWEDAIARAKPMDLEELGVLIMIMLWGPEPTRVWLGQGFTVKFGLGKA